MADAPTPVESNNLEPGQTITPNSAPQAAIPVSSTPAVTEPSPAAEPAIPQPEVNPTEAQPVDTYWAGEAEDPPEKDKGDSVTWTASEFIAHDKSAGWYAGLVLAAIIIALLAWVFTHSIFSVVVIFICAGMFGYFGSHKPRDLRYQLDYSGLTIENKAYSYNDFKSFSILPEGNLSSIIFLPLKRFIPPLTIYYDPAIEEKIMSVLSARIPMEQGRRDAVDRLINRVHF